MTLHHVTLLIFIKYLLILKSFSKYYMHMAEVQKITEGLIEKRNVSLLLHMASIPILRSNTFNPFSNFFSVILNYIIT